VILYDFCLLPAQFSDEIINVRNFNCCVQVTLQLMVSQPVRLGVEPLLGLMSRFYL
jgi:hypothetical protein